MGHAYAHNERQRVCLNTLEKYPSEAYHSILSISAAAFEATFLTLSPSS